jgi:hypothetical protein
VTIYAATGPTDGFNLASAFTIVRRALEELPFDAAGLTAGAQRPTLFRSGGAVGVDSIFAIEARKIWPAVPLEFVVPAAAPYNRVLVRRMVETDQLVTVTHIEAPEGASSSEKYMLRNDALVAKPTERLLAFPLTRIEEQRSGTWATVRRARKALVSVIYFPLDEPGSRGVDDSASQL